jgi:soluble lytic murein transglycosylase
MGLANAYRGARKTEEGIALLAEIVREHPESPEAPTALYRLGRTYWNHNENLKALDHFKQLKKSYPKSAVVDFVEFASARIYESLGMSGDALGIYQDFSKRFPDSSLREEAQWRLAWIHYLQADHDRAFAAFKSVAAEKGERYKTAALYWQGRAAEKMGRFEEATKIFLRILNGYQDSYYAGPASRRLEKIGVRFEEKVAKSPALSVEPSPPLSPNLSFHLSRAQELTRISLNRLAVAELDAIKADNGDPALTFILMREYARNQAYERSVAVANGIHNPSEEVDRYRYPLAYWETVQKNAAERELDPYLVVALIRQESLFNPKALSPASAHGLMQILPSTAARMARQIGEEPPAPERLFDSELNLRLGAHYLKELLQRYAGNPVRAIAAYNAGENAVDRWGKEISVDDDDEFIERIPYGETRLYVKLVLRNHRLYRKIYPEPKKEPRQEY